MKNRKFFWIFFLIFLCFHPLLFAFVIIQEDPSVLGKGELEFDQLFYGTKYTAEIVNGEKEKLNNIDSYWFESWSEFYYGINNSLNFRLAVPFDAWKYEDIEGQEREIGLSDVRLGLKLNLFNNCSVFSGIKTKTGSLEKELGTGKNELFVNFIYGTDPEADINLIFNFNSQVSEDEKFFSSGFGINYCLNEEFEICLEMFNENISGTYNQIFVAPGFTFEMINDFYMGFALQIPVLTVGNIEEYFNFMPYLGIFTVR